MDLQVLEASSVEPDQTVMKEQFVQSLHHLQLNHHVLNPSSGNQMDLQILAASSEDSSNSS